MRRPGNWLLPLAGCAWGRFCFSSGSSWNGLSNQAWLSNGSLLLVKKQAIAVPAWAGRTVPLLRVTEGIAKKITDTHYVIPVIGVGRFSTSGQPGGGSRLALVLDDVRDPGNIGTLVRTARAFGIREVWGTRREFDPFSRKVIDASRGLVFSTRFIRTDSPVEAAVALKKVGFEIVATSPRGGTLQSRLNLSGRPLALVAGNETTGVSEPLMAAADHVIQIPMRAVESLNVAVATGISIYELGFKLVLSMLTNSIRNTFGREFGATHELMHKVLDRKLREVGPVGADEVIFLMRLACDRVSRLGDAAKDLQRDGAAVEEFLDRLAAAGWLSRGFTSDQELISITAAGEELLAQLWPVVEAAHDQALAGLTEDELQQLRRLMRQIQDNCQKHLPDL